MGQAEKVKETRVEETASWMRRALPAMVASIAEGVRKMHMTGVEEEARTVREVNANLAVLGDLEALDVGAGGQAVLEGGEPLVGLAEVRKKGREEEGEEGDRDVLGLLRLDVRDVEVERVGLESLRDASLDSSAVEADEGLDRGREGEVAGPVHVGVEARNGGGDPIGKR